MHSSNLKSCVGSLSLNTFDSKLLASNLALNLVADRFQSPQLALDLGLTREQPKPYLSSVVLMSMSDATKIRKLTPETPVIPK